MDKPLSLSDLSNAVFRHLNQYTDPSVNLNLINRYTHPDLDLTFLLSFPRSGNGYVRFLITSIVLAHQGYPIERAKRKGGLHHSNQAPTQHLHFPDGIAPISIDDVVPNAHTFPIDWISRIPENLSIGATRLVKTHSIIPQGTAAFLYLFRTPLESCTSYYQLLGQGRFSQLMETHSCPILPTRFEHLIGHFLDLYIALGEHALACVTSGQCQPLSLARLEAKDPQQLCRWLERCQANIPSDRVEKALHKYQKRSSFDRSMLDLWTASLKDQLARAEDVYARLEASG